MTEAQWKVWLEEKAALLEEAARWKTSSHLWEAEALKHARENVTLRHTLKRRLKLVIEAIPETA